MSLLSYTIHLMEYLVYYFMKVDSYSFVSIKWVENVLKHFITAGIKESLKNDF